MTLTALARRERARIVHRYLVACGELEAAREVLSLLAFGRVELGCSVPAGTAETALDAVGGLRGRVSMDGCKNTFVL